MPIYDYACPDCDNVIEVFHKMDEKIRCMCRICKKPMQKIISFGAGDNYRRPDAKWIEGVNGYMNDLEMVQRGKQEYISTREQARAQIKRLYADPYPEARTKEEVAANKRVGLLRQRYLERY